MKRLLRVLTFCGISVLALVIAFKAGRWAENNERGYFYEVRTEKKTPFLEGHIWCRYVTESFGSSLFDSGTSVLTLEYPMRRPITIYKAERIFQESYRYVAEVTINGNRVEWQDGVNQHVLEVRPLQAE